MGVDVDQWGAMKAVNSSLRYSFQSWIRFVVHVLISLHCCSFCAAAFGHHFREVAHDIVGDLVPKERSCVNIGCIVLFV